MFNEEKQCRAVISKEGADVRRHEVDAIFSRPHPTSLFRHEEEEEEEEEDEEKEDKDDGGETRKDRAKYRLPVPPRFTRSRETKEKEGGRDRSRDPSKVPELGARQNGSLVCRTDTLNIVDIEEEEEEEEEVVVVVVVEKEEKKQQQ
uniref:Uncharacterized protein n=1 Tax=Vespula pensylvanica TaxID=30213 RepID=A0A834P9J7_VESPE|nr:hypothetical protein H0235_002113 [Vespula pensylvanica]